MYGDEQTVLEDIMQKLHAVKPLKSRHLRVFKNLSVTERCPLLGGNLTKIVTFGTKQFVCYSTHVRYLGCPLLEGFTVENLGFVISTS